MGLVQKINPVTVLFPVLVLVSGSASFANGPGPGVAISNAYVDTLWLMREARDPSRSPSQKRAAAQRGLEFIRAQVGSQLPIKNLDELPAYFSAHPELNNSIALKDPKGLGRVVTEFNLLLADLRAGEKLKNCDDGTFSQGVKIGMAGFDPCIGGCTIQGNFCRKPVKKGNGVAYTERLPTFASDNVQSILDSATLADFFDEKNEGKNPFRPTMAQVKKANPKISTEAELSNAGALAQIRGNAYQQAISREVRNRMTLLYQYGDTPGGKTWDEMKGLIREAVKTDCKHCTPEMENSIASEVQGSLARDINHQVIIKKKDLGAIAEGFCKNIKAKGYPFSDGPEEQLIYKRYEEISRGMVGAPSAAGLGLSQTMEGDLKVLEDRRKAILSEIISEGGDGILLLTSGLSKLDGAMPNDIKLKCDAASKANDANLVSEAAKEAMQKTKDYAGKLNSLIHPESLDLESQKKALDELLKIAPGAVGEALNYSHPLAASLVCNSLRRLQREDNIQALQDGAVMWGATVVGVVATIFTRGAAAPVVMAGMGISAAAGAGAAAYSWNESEEAKALAQEYRDAALAQGVDPTLLNLSETEYFRFKEQKFNAILSGVFSAVEFANLVAAGAKTGKSLKQINDEIEMVIKNPREKASWLKQNAKALAADAAINTAISSAANGYITGDFTPDPAQIAMGMVIGSGIRTLGKQFTPEESAKVRDRMNSLRTEMKKTLRREPTPDELVFEYSKNEIPPPEKKTPTTVPTDQATIESNQGMVTYHPPRRKPSRYEDENARLVGDRVTVQTANGNQEDMARIMGEPNSNLGKTIAQLEKKGAAFVLDPNLVSAPGGGPFTGGYVIEGVITSKKSGESLRTNLLAIAPEHLRTIQGEQIVKHEGFHVMSRYRRKTGKPTTYRTRLTGTLKGLPEGETASLSTEEVHAYAKDFIGYSTVNQGGETARAIQEHLRSKPGVEMRIPYSEIISDRYPVEYNRAVNMIHYHHENISVVAKSMLDASKIKAGEPLPFSMTFDKNGATVMRVPHAKGTLDYTVQDLMVKNGKPYDIEKVRGNLNLDLFRDEQALGNLMEINRVVGDAGKKGYFTAQDYLKFQDLRGKLSKAVSSNPDQMTKP